MKDSIYDYSISAFVFYAHNGRSLDGYKDILYKDSLNEAKYLNISPVYLYERNLKENRSSLADIEAVEKVLYQLQKDEAYEVISSLDLVYFSLPFHFKRGDLSNRIIKAAMYLPADERTVQRYLSKARKLFAIERGLRC